MTLKSGRNDSVSSMRTALSDLYLEHLLQNKPKAEVRRRAGGDRSAFRVGSRRVPLKRSHGIEAPWTGESGEV